LVFIRLIVKLIYLKFDSGAATGTLYGYYYDTTEQENVFYVYVTKLIPPF